MMIHDKLRFTSGVWRMALIVALIAAGPVFADPSSGRSLVTALRAGGYVVLMRHASSPRQPPDSTIADSQNPQLERQLDENGRISAQAFGDALRKLRIPVGQVLSSPTYRALETIKLAQLGTPITFPELGDAGGSMSADVTGTRGAWLKAKSAAHPASGRNTIIVTHYPNIIEAYPHDAAGLADGEALVLRPDQHGGTRVIARVKIEEWPSLESGQ